MVLTHPDFAVDRPADLAKEITDAEWWIWCRLHELESTSELGGILAWKSGFHSTGQYNIDNYPGNYSYRDPPNKTGPWWKTHASALDWTFPEAHSGNYSRISKYMQRLLASARDAADPRLDLVLYEFYGQADQDSYVEGWNEYRDQDATSEPSHLFHIHFSFLRVACGDFWAMWALLTVLMGWTVAQWRASLTTTSADGEVETEQEGEGEMLITYIYANAKDGKPTRWGKAILSAGQVFWYETADQGAANGYAVVAKVTAAEVTQKVFDEERAKFAPAATR